MATRARYLGKGVQDAVDAVVEQIAPEITLIIYIGSFAAMLHEYGSIEGILKEYQNLTGIDYNELLQQMDTAK